jgi:hypothetical protein
MAADRNESTKERAPLLLVFGDLAPRVAALVRARPLLIARLIVAPREAVHSIGAFLHLAPDAARSDAEVATIINDTDPRDLLNVALPGCPARLYRALDRAGDRVQARRFYERLGVICRGPFADLLLADGLIDDASIAHYETLSKLDPAVGALPTVFKANTYLAQSVDSLIALLRAHGALRDGDLRLPAHAGLPAVVRRLRAANGRIEAPDPGFIPPQPFRIIRTTDELQRIGKALGNCVALPQWGAVRYHLNLIDGTAVFLVSDDPPLLALLHRVADRVFYLEQCAGPKNASPPAGVRSALIRDLTAAGLRLVLQDPQSSLGRLEQEAGRGRRGGDDIEVDLGDDDDDHDDEVAA